MTNYTEKQIDKILDNIYLEKQIDTIYSECYYMPLNYFDSEKDIVKSILDDSFYEKFEERTEYFQRIFNYSSEAMEYLKENDVLLSYSIELAKNMGFSLENVNSCILAGLLLTDEEKKKQKECFEKLKDFIVNEELER